MDRELRVAVEAAKTAGRILIRGFRKDFKVKRKSRNELVTSLDIECEREIVSIIQRAFPEHGVLSEEKGFDEKQSDSIWLIDPLDGTHNFVFGIPIFGVSIAFAVKGQVQCGVILLPAFNELFTAERGRGAFLNGSRIRVSTRSPRDSVVNFCSLFLQHHEKTRALQSIKSKVLNVRLLGSSAFNLASIATGRMDALIEFDDKPTDFAAGWLLVEEAGGKFSRIDGADSSLWDSSYLASNRVLHDWLVDVLRGLK